MCGAAFGFASAALKLSDPGGMGFNDRRRVRWYVRARLRARAFTVGIGFLHEKFSDLPQNFAFCGGARSRCAVLLLK